MTTNKMVQVVVLSANGELRNLKTTAFSSGPGSCSGATVAKALRKKNPAELVGSYTTKTGLKLSVWGWRSGKAGTENKHDLPPMGDGADEGLLFGDAVIVSSGGDYTVEQWETFYDEAFGGFESLDSEGEEADAEEEDDYEEKEEGEDEEVDEEKEEEEDEDGDAEDEEEEEEEEDMEDDDCYDEGDENGGGSKRRTPRRRTIASTECRRIDMGLRSRIRLPTQIGKRAPRWQTAPELEEEAYV